ncbi:Topoisomerase 1-associated factor 1, variant 2 [Orbilia brochopaga]
MTLNHHRHIATLRRSQISYKQAILTHRSKSILKACCMNALPAMATPPSERTPRDDGIIRLILYFIRNVLQIESTEEGNSDVWEDVSRSSTLESFEIQGIFDFLLSVVAGIPEAFEQQDVVVLEVIFHMIQGIDCEQLPTAIPGNEPSHHKLLSEMLQREDGSKGAPKLKSRHNRFGTTVVVQKESGQRAVLAGHGALVDEETGLRKLDTTKKWRKPHYTGRKQVGLFGADVSLSFSAQCSLRKFLINVLHSGFSALFQSVRKAIERDSERVVGTTHSTQLFYVGSAMIEFFRSSIRNAGETTGTDDLGFGELSALLHAETFIVLFKHMRECLELKAWDDLRAGCLYFTQILLLVTEMMQSENTEEKSVAENTLSRLFYEETLQELIVAVLRSGRKQSVQYLDTVTEMTHVYLRSLEKYSKSHADMVVKSKRTTGPRDAEKDHHGSDDDAEGSTQSHPTEKQFDFLKCESKFLSQSSLESFLDFLGYYRELQPSQIKRCIAFLHRVFVKRETTVGLFRARTILLLHRLAKETELLSGYSDVVTFVKYFSRQLARKLNECPVLFVELLFPKSTKTAYFLQHGKDREFERKRTRLPSALEFGPDLSRETRIAVALSLVIQDEACSNQLPWIESVMQIALEERKRWQSALANDQEITGVSPSLGPAASEFVVSFDDPEHVLAHVTSNKLQLLMSCLGFQANGTADQNEFAYILPSAVSGENLQESIDILLRTKQSPLSHLENGEDISSCVRVKRRKRPQSLGEEENDAILSSEGDFEFPDNLREKKQRGRSKKAASSRQERDMLDEEEARARREQRKINEQKRREGIKSALYIASSDDDSDVERDREFFEEEKKLREKMSRAAIEAPGGEDLDDGPHVAQKKKKKKKRSNSDGSAGEQKRARISLSSSESEGDASQGKGSDNPSDEEMRAEA